MVAITVVTIDHTYATPDAVDVSTLGVTPRGIIRCDTTGGSITIGGFTGGVDGYEVILVKPAAGNSLIIEHAEGTGTEKILTGTGADITLGVNDYGGIHFACALSGADPKWFALGLDNVEPAKGQVAYLPFLELLQVLLVQFLGYLAFFVGLPVALAVLRARAVGLDAQLESVAIEKRKKVFPGQLVARHVIGGAQLPDIEHCEPRLLYRGRNRIGKILVE